jgi:hypothetical protein
MINRDMWWSTGLRMLLRACFVTLLLLPAVIALGLYMIPNEERILWIVLVPFVHVAGDAIGRSLSRWRRWIPETLIVVIILAYVNFAFGLTSVGVITALVYGFFMIQGTSRPANGQLFSVHQAYYVASFVLYLIITFWYRDNTEHEGYLWLMNLAGMLTLILSLFLFNNSNMNRESYSDSSSGAPVSRSIVSQNRLLVSVVAVIVFLIASISWIGEMLSRVYESFIAWLRRLLGDNQQQIIQPEPAAPDNLMMEPLQDPSWFMQLLEKIATFIGGALIVVLVLWLGYRLLRKLPIVARLIEQWLQRLSRKERLAASNAGYEDEIEQIEHERGMSRLRRWSSSLLRGRTEERWDKLPNNAARIRELYRSALLRRERDGYAPKPQLTPRETAVDLQHSKSQASELPRPLVELYERARYSASPIDTREAEQARELEQQIMKKR